MDHTEEVILAHFQARDDVMLNPANRCGQSGCLARLKYLRYVGVALAVRAVIGTSGKRSRNLPSWRYSSRKSWPHSYCSFNRGSMALAYLCSYRDAVGLGHGVKKDGMSCMKAQAHLVNYQTVQISVLMKQIQYIGRFFCHQFLWCN